MSELPGTAAVGIDAVEWEEQDEGNLTLRVSGRWRRRPRGTSGKPTLILESGGRRHRFSALPEPPGLGGAPPGAWRLSFTLPGTLAPDLGRTWLQFGTVIVPLPIAMPTAEELRALREPAPRPEPEREPRADPPYLQAVPDLNEARAPAPPEADRDVGGDLDFDDIGERVAALERDLRHARAGRDELAASLQERDRSRRIAEQRAHAESALRQDLARQLSANLREMERVREAMGELAAAEERIRRLEAELELARRRSAEAEQIAAAARAARERAERERDEARANPPAAEARAHPPAAEAVRPDAPEPPGLVDPAVGEGAPAAPAPAPAAGDPAPALTAGDPAEPERLALERRLALSWPAEDRWRPDEPVARATVAPAPVSGVPPVAPAAAPELPLPTVPPRPPATAQSGPVVPDLLRRELDTRARAEAALRSRLVDAESTLAARIVLERRTKHALDELRAELAGLRDALAAERAAREETEARLADARARVDTVRSELAVAETRAESAAGQIAAARTEAAQAHARIDGALAHAAQAENRAVQADARAQEREAQLSALTARLSAAEAKAGEAEARRREAEARVGEAESERAAADAFAQTTAAARTAADSRAETAERRARAAAAEALRLREELAQREAERAALAEQVDALQARIVQLEQDLSGQRVLSRDAYDAIGDLRQTLELVQARAAEASSDAGGSPDAASDADGSPAGPSEAPPEAGVVDADRLSDALTRLRQTVPAPEDVPGGDDAPPPPGAELPGPPAVPGGEVAEADSSLERLLHRRSLEVPFRRLLRTDPAAAGRLLIELLPLQPSVHPRAVTYDLVLGEGGGCVCVTSPHGDPPIEVRAHPRPREEVDLRIIGDPARIARRLTAGRLRRVFGIGLARCRGRREALAALQALIATPLDLTELEPGGVHLEPASVFGLVAAMIDPPWTRGERFVLAHEQDGLITAYLTVADGHPPRATQAAPAERVATTLTGPGDQLLRLFAGRSAPGLAVRGDEGPLLAVRRWLRQAGHV
jgi:hypothetical protein